MTLFKEPRNLFTLSLGVGVSLLWFAAYLRDIENEANHTESGPAVGVLIEAGSDVSRRPRSRLAWIPLGARNEVFERDTLRTGPESRALVDLGTHGRLELKPESLAVLEFSGETFQVNLASGDLFVSGQGIQAKVGNSVIKSKNADLKISRSSRTGELKVESSKGSAEVIGEQGTQTLNAGQRLTQKGVGPTEIETIPLECLLPPPTATKNFSNTSTLELSTRALVPEGQNFQNLFAELSTQKNFKRSRRIPLTDQGKAVVAGLTEGFYYWRVVQEDRTRKGSPLRSLCSDVGFEVRYPLKISWRKDQPIPIPVSLGDDGLSFSIKWTSSHNIPAYEIEFYDARTERPLAQFKTERSTTFKVVREKNSLWQFLSQSSPSKLQELRILVSTPEHIAQKLPPLSAAVALVDSRTPPAPLRPITQLVESENRVNFEWRSPESEEALIYEIGVKDKVLDTLKSQLEFDKTPQWVAETLETGPIWIRSKNAKGLASTPVPFADLDLTKLHKHLAARTAPEPFFPGKNHTFTLGAFESLLLRWKQPKSRDSNYRPLQFEIAVKHASGSQTFLTPKNSHNFSPTKTGFYSWKVRAEWPQKGWGPYSPESSFSVVAPELRAPKLRTPSSTSP